MPVGGHGGGQARPCRGAPAASLIFTPVSAPQIATPNQLPHSLLPVASRWYWPAILD